MKKNKIATTLATKKSKNIPAHATAAPTVKKQSENSLKEKGTKKDTSSKIKRIEKNMRKRFTQDDTTKLIVCTFNKKGETLPVEIKTKNKKGESIVIKKTYYGVDAAKIVLKKNNIKPEILTSSYCAIKVPLNDAQKVVDALSPYGYVSIPLVFKNAGIKTKNTIPKRKKKPTNNTQAVRIAAKEARKISNLASKKNRKTNLKKSLAKTHSLVSVNGDAIRTKNINLGITKENPVTWNGHKVKSMRRAKKALRMIERKEKMNAARIVQEQKNIEKKKAKIKVANTKKEQPLNFKEAA